MHAKSFLSGYAKAYKQARTAETTVEVTVEAIGDGPTVHFSVHSSGRVKIAGNGFLPESFLTSAPAARALIFAAVRDGWATPSNFASTRECLELLTGAGLFERNGRQ